VEKTTSGFLIATVGGLISQNLITPDRQVIFHENTTFDWLGQHHSHRCQRIALLG
jgi:hypothetical protein